MYNNLTATVSEVWSASAGAWVYDVSSVYKRYYYGVYYPVAVHNVNTEQAAFTVYPNPSSGAITVSVAHPNFKKGTLVIYDITGKVVYSQPLISDFRFQITLHQPKGSYIIRLQLDNAITTRQLIIE